MSKPLSYSRGDSVTRSGRKFKPVPPPVVYRGGNDSSTTMGDVEQGEEKHIEDNYNSAAMVDVSLHNLNQLDSTQEVKLPIVEEADEDLSSTLFRLALQSPAPAWKQIHTIAQFARKLEEFKFPLYYISTEDAGFTNIQRISTFAPDLSQQPASIPTHVFSFNPSKAQLRVVNWRDASAAQIPFEIVEMNRANPDGRFQMQSIHRKWMRNRSAADLLHHIILHYNTIPVVWLATGEERQQIWQQLQNAVVATERYRTTTRSATQQQLRKRTPAQTNAALDAHRKKR